jgi:hypothetical protein
LVDEGGSSSGLVSKRRSRSCLCYSRPLQQCRLFSGDPVHPPLRFDHTRIGSDPECLQLFRCESFTGLCSRILERRLIGCKRCSLRSLHLLGGQRLRRSLCRKLSGKRLGCSPGRLFSGERDRRGLG